MWTVAVVSRPVLPERSEACAGFPRQDCHCIKARLDEATSVSLQGSVLVFGDNIITPKP